jgi:hydrogenase maturation protease/hydrogenase 3 maturation protease
MSAPRTHIICFGNLLQGDDGFSIHVLNRLREVDLPSHTKAFDGGITGLSALSFFEDCERAIVVDALGFDGEVGRIKRLSLVDIDAPEVAFSAHQLDVNHLFHVLPILFEGRTAPEVTIVGAEIGPCNGSFSMDLSPDIERAKEQALDLILREIGFQRLD